MVFNSTGIDNTGVGYFTLYNNDTGNSNSAVGSDTLISNISGDCNVAVGESALLANTTGTTISPSAATPAVRLRRAVTISILAISVRMTSPTLSGSATRQFTQEHFWQEFPQAAWQRFCSTTIMAPS